MVVQPLFNYPDSVLVEEELVGGVLDENDCPRPKSQLDGTIKDRDKHDADEQWLYKHLAVAGSFVSEGYQYCHVNEDALLSATAVDGGVRVGNATFKVLVFNAIEALSVELARKLGELAAKGVPVVFKDTLPSRQPGYHDHERNDATIKELLDTGVHDSMHLVDFTQDLVIYVRDVVGVSPDVSYEMPQKHVHYSHRAAADGSHVYFFRHSKNYVQRFKARFPHATAPLLLDPVSGESVQAPVYSNQGDHTTVDMALGEYGSCLLHFPESDAAPGIHATMASGTTVRNEDGSLSMLADKPGIYRVETSDGSARVASVSAGDVPPIIPINQWNFKVDVRDKKGKLKHVNMKIPEPVDWRELPGLEYCSGVGLYSGRFRLDIAHFKDGIQLLLKLGSVADVAEVRVNDAFLPPLLHAPWAVDITGVARTGENFIQVQVTPTLRNQLEGYSRRPKRSRLAPAGLLEPVRVVPRLVIPVETMDIEGKE